MPLRDDEGAAVQNHHQNLQTFKLSNFQTSKPETSIIPPFHYSINLHQFLSILSLFLFANATSRLSRDRQNRYVVAAYKFYHNVASNEAFYANKQYILSNKFDCPPTLLKNNEHQTRNTEQRKKQTFKLPNLQTSKPET